MSGRISDCLNISMEANKEDNSVEKEIAAKGDIDLVKSETDHPFSFEMYMSLPPGTPVAHLRKNKTNAVQHRELRDNRKCLLDLLRGNCENPEENSQLLHEMQDYFRRETQRRMVQELVTFNRACSQLEKVWLNRGLPVDKESLQSAAASKDPFDMRSLSESLPSKPHIGDGGELGNKAKKLSEDFISIIKHKKLALVRSEMASLRASNTPELNNNLPSCSSEIHQPDTLTDSVRKACQDMKRNIRMFSLRPLRTQKGEGVYIPSNSSVSGEKINPLRKLLLDLKDEEINVKIQNLDVESKLQSNLTEMTQKMDMRTQYIPSNSSVSGEKINPLQELLLDLKNDKINVKIQNLDVASKLQSNLTEMTQKMDMRTQYTPSNSSVHSEEMEAFHKIFDDCEDKINEKTQNLDVESKLQNNPTQNKACLQGYQELGPGYFHFMRSPEGRHSNLAEHVQHFRNSILLDRQMSRLKIANSGRGDLLEGIDESELKEASSDQNKDEQKKAAMDNRRKTARQKLIELYNSPI